MSRNNLRKRGAGIDVCNAQTKSEYDVDVADISTDALRIALEEGLKTLELMWRTGAIEARRQRQAAMRWRRKGKA